LTAYSKNSGRKLFHASTETMGVPLLNGST
jgi:hypothetical protein